MLKQTISSETSRLNDLKNCEYHRAKIKQFLNDYNRCVEENIKLKENNERLMRSKANTVAKYEIAQKKLD